MSASNNDFFTASFSHIYVEKEALSSPLTQAILQRFRRSVRIEIDHYKDVFARSRQNFFVQKQAPKLILAVKKEPFVYRGAEVCHDFGNAHFYYASSALNCVYNCDYCFLQGMFPSANMVLFVNTADYFAAVSAMLREHPVYLCISYESDLLAFESVAPFASQWIEYARTEPDLTVELRTKSANYGAIRHLPPSPNVILAWTVSPEPVIRRHEPLTPGLTARLGSIRQAAADGWKVRLCFDPVLHIEDWQQHYRECVAQTFSAVPADAVHDVSIGVFRMPRDYLKKIRRRRPDAALLHYPYENKNGVLSYPDQVAEQLVGFVYREVRAHVREDKIYTE